MGRQTDRHCRVCLVFGFDVLSSIGVILMSQWKFGVLTEYCALAFIKEIHGWNTGQGLAAFTVT